MTKSHILAVVCLCAPLTVHATSVAYQSDDQLFDRADVVMVAKVWRYAIDVHTDYELEALECFKGCVAGQFLMMYSPGVSMKRVAPGIHESIEGAPHPEVGDQIIVHLVKEGDRLSLMSLGLSLHTMRYNTALKRYIAHRETDNIFILKPSNGTPARDASNQFLVSQDAFASDVIDRLRNKAKGR